MFVECLVGGAEFNHHKAIDALDGMAAIASVDIERFVGIVHLLDEFIDREFLYYLLIILTVASSKTV